MIDFNHQGGSHVTFPGRGALLALCALLASGCESEDQRAIRVSYDAAVRQAQADCVAKGGDEFHPYGADSWIGFFAGKGMAGIYRCRRLEKHWKRSVAVYVLRLEGTEVKVETR